MPKLVNQPPKYCHHKGSGQAYVTLPGHGKPIYLGEHGSAESKREYKRLIAEWVANDHVVPASAGGSADLTIAELLLPFWKHCQSYYRRPDGTQTSEVSNFAGVIRLLRKMYGDVPVKEFGPLKLKAVRQKMIEEGWVRSSINRNTGRIRQIFKWGASNEMLPASLCEGLRTVEGLREGRTNAKESEPVRPVPEAFVEETKKYLSRQAKAMIDLQLLTGMRPGEVCAMRGCDIDTTGKIWLYKPPTHKTRHHGHERPIYLGPKAQEVVKPFLRPNLQEYLFQPAEAWEEFQQARHAERKTPMNQGNKPGSNRVHRPRKKPGEKFAETAYARSIVFACEKAFGMPDEYREPHTKAAIEKEKKLSPEDQKKRREKRAKQRSEWRQQHVWTPHQLRHNAGTRLRKEYGLEAAQVILGHKTLKVTEIYAEKNVAAAQRIMAEVG